MKEVVKKVVKKVHGICGFATYHNSGLLTNKLYLIMFLLVFSCIHSNRTDIYSFCNPSKCFRKAIESILMILCFVAVTKGQEVVCGPADDIDKTFLFYVQGDNATEPCVDNCKAQVSVI